MRRLGTVFVCLMTSVAFAQSGSLGTKADLVSHAPASAAVGAWDVLQMIAALAIVFALLKWALPKIVAKMNRRMGSSSSDTIRLEESAMFGGCQLQIITVRGRTFLLGSTQAGVNCLADLSNPVQPKDEPAFFELVDSATESDPTSNQDLLALERLKRLTS